MSDNSLIEHVKTKCCTDTYKLKKDGSTVKGQAMSFLIKRLRDDGYRGVSYHNITKMVDNTTELAFGEATNRRGSRCEVVYLPVGGNT